MARLERHLFRKQDYYVGAEPTVGSNFMKWAVIFLLFLLWAMLVTSPFHQSVKNEADKKWLEAAQHMLVVNHDPLISTTDINRVMILIQWATTNGYSVEVSHDGGNAGYKPEMYFTIVKKL